MTKAKWKPKSVDYQSAIRSQNPWHHKAEVPAALAPKTYRPLAKVLWQSLLSDRATRHQLILGPRRVGKTTVMHQTVSELLAKGISPDRLWWLRLDHPLLMDWDLGDLVQQIFKSSRANAEKPVFIFLDELTYADRWDLWLKTFFDEKWPVRIVGTSSATAAMRQRGTESGVGRWDEHFLAPCLFTEYLDLRQHDHPAIHCQQSLGQTIAATLANTDGDFYLSNLRHQFLITGGFPELLVENRNTDETSELLRSQRVLRSDAIEKAIYKDIPQAFKLEDPTKLERLLYIVAGQMTGVVSPNTIAADLAVATATVERYIGYLERAFIVFTLPNYSASEESVQRRGKKIFFVDGAVRNAALLRGTAPMNEPTELSLLTENMAASHLRALAYQDNVRLYHWRHKSQYEFDFVYDHPNEPLAFEITIANSHNQKSIGAFQERFGKFRGSCYIVSESKEIVAPTMNAPGMLPLDLFFLIVGRQAQFALEGRLGKANIAGGGSQLLLF